MQWLWYWDLPTMVAKQLSGVLQMQQERREGGRFMLNKVSLFALSLLVFLGFFLLEDP